MSTEITKRVIPTLFGSIRQLPRTDYTLTKEGYCADAKAVGDILRNEQRAVNFSYNNNGNGLNATTIQEALDELNENNKATDESVKAVGKRELLCSGTLDTLYDIDASKYRFIYYELRTSADLCMMSNLIPVSMLTAVVQEFNHTEYATANYNAEITVQIKTSSIKAYTKSLTGWNLTSFKVYGIY